MKHTTRTYVALAVVFLLSVAATSLLPIGDAFRDIAATPAVMALIVALWQIFRDQASFEKNQQLQRQQQIFSLGTTSHMANLAFDKHVEFCEKYMYEIHETVNTLFREGPTDKAFEHVGHFVELQRQYAAWIPKDVAIALDPFVRAVNKIAALSGLETSLGSSDPKGRANAIEEMYKVFYEVMQINDPKNVNGNSDVAIEEVKERVRAILGIEQLTRMRRKLVQQALDSLENES